MKATWTDQRRTRVSADDGRGRERGTRITSKSVLRTSTTTWLGSEGLGAVMSSCSCSVVMVAGTQVGLGKAACHEGSAGMGVDIVTLCRNRNIVVAGRARARVRRKKEAQLGSKDNSNADLGQFQMESSSSSSSPVSTGCPFPM